MTVGSILILFSFYLFSPLFVQNSALALSVQISNTPSQVTDQAFDIDVSIDGASSGTNYLRANLFPSGTTYYFGYTYNGSSFINTSDYSQYLPITIPTSGNWSGTIQAKVDAASSYYSGSGTYSLKVRRYTQSGSSYTWSNETTLTISLSSPTPTPSSSPSITTSPNPSASSSPSTTPTPTSSSKPQIVFSISNAPSSIDSNQDFEVTISASNLDPSSSYYLKGAFQKSGSTNYFGKTYASNNWVKNNQTYSSQFTINTDSDGSWNGKLKVMPDHEDNGFIGTGSYIFKVGRYSKSGSGPTWSNETTISIKKTEETVTATTSPSPSASSSSKSVIALVKSNNEEKKENKLADYHLSLATSSSDVAGASTGDTSETIIESQRSANKNYYLLLGSLLLIAGIFYVFYKSGLLFKLVLKFKKP